MSAPEERLQADTSAPVPDAATPAVPAPDAPAAQKPNKVLAAATLLLLLVFAGFSGLKIFLPYASAPKLNDALVQELQDVTLEPVKAAPKAKAAAQGWPQWRGPNRDGKSTEKGLALTWSDAGPPRVWEKPLGKGFSAIVAAEGKAYTIFQDGDKEAVICLKIDDGSELWRFEYAADYRNPFGNGPRSTPAIDGKHIYTVGGTGIMHCLKTDPKTPAGEAVWRKDLLREFNADNLKWGVSFSPLVVGDLVYANPGGPDGNSLVAFNKKTGDLVWKSEGDIAGYSSPVEADLVGKKQIVFFTERGLVSVTPDKGEVLWRFPWITEAGCNIATPITFKNYVFISTGYGHGSALIKIDKTPEGLDAKPVFESVRLCNHFSTSVRFDDHVYGFNERVLTCMSLRDGKVKWRERGFGKGTVLGVDDKLILLGEDGILAVADAAPEAYRESARTLLPTGRYWTVPSLAQGRLFIRNESTVLCFDLRK